MVEEAQETQENLEEVTVPKPEAMAEVALNTISRLTLHDLIDGAIQVLVTLYTIRPDSYQYDASNEIKNNASPFGDVVRCMIGDRDSDSYQVEE